MSKVAPVVPAHLLEQLPHHTSLSLFEQNKIYELAQLNKQRAFHEPEIMRLIGKIPVFADDDGEFSLVTVKVIHYHTKSTSEMQVKVDADIESIRTANALTLRHQGDIKNSAENSKIGMLVFQNGSNRCVSGEQSLPGTLFGKKYRHARHARVDVCDFRKAAFTPASTNC